MPLSIEEWKQYFDKASGDDVAKGRAVLAELGARLTEQCWLSHMSVRPFLWSSTETSSQLAACNEKIDESQTIQRA